MNGPAISRTSSGDSGVSNAAGKGISPLSRLRYEACRASTATIEPAAVSSSAFVQELPGAVVGADARVLQRHRRRQEGRRIGVGVAEVVGRLRDRLAAEIGDDRGQGLDVLALVFANRGKLASIDCPRQSLPKVNSPTPSR